MEPVLLGGPPKFIPNFKNKYQVKPIRGNVETRIKKLKEGQFDAVVMALAGINRLGLHSELTEVLDTDVMLPAPCQGCLGLELREDDNDIFEIVKSISDENSDITARAERAFLQGVGGSCLVPLAGLAEKREDRPNSKRSASRFKGRKQNKR